MHLMKLKQLQITMVSLMTYHSFLLKNFPIGNLGLSYTKTDKEYNQVDTFVHPSIVRNDDVENYSFH